MRGLTETEKAALFDEGHCPFCLGTEIQVGPSGGICTNIKCVTCEAVFNVSPNTTFRIAQLVHPGRVPAST